MKPSKPSLASTPDVLACGRVHKRPRVSWKGIPRWRSLPIGAGVYEVTSRHPNFVELFKAEVRCLMDPGLIHVLGSLCTTTTCRCPAHGVGELRSHPCASGKAFYAGSCKGTSENLYSPTLGE
jgi:hypothetical protein